MTRGLVLVQPTSRSRPTPPHQHPTWPTKGRKTREENKEYLTAQLESPRLPTLARACTRLPALARAYPIMWWVIGLVGLIWYVLVILVMFLGVFKIYRMNKIAMDPAGLARAPGVTILRPLKGLDTELYQTLRSCFDQRAQFELIFCVAEADDPAVAVAQRLIDEFPEADAKIMIGEDNYGPNPKINNLSKGYKAAKYDLIWVLDSNVAVSPLTLPQALGIFAADPSVQLVHNLPVAIYTRGDWGGKLEEMYLLTAHSKFYSGINEVAIAPCICGKSNFYRRSDLDRATGSPAGEGIRSFALYISEDQLIAQALWAQGGRTRFANQPVVQPLGASNARTFALRRIRWLRVRKYMVMAATLVEPTTESIMAGLMGVASWSGIRGTGFSWPLFALHMTLWCALDYFNFHNIAAFEQFGDQGATLVPPFVANQGWRAPGEWILVWLGRELMCLPIYIMAWCGSSIEWRNKPFRIRHDLVAEEVVH